MFKAKRQLVLVAVLTLFLLGSFLSSGNRVTASVEYPMYELVYTYYSDAGMTTVVGHGLHPCGSHGIYMTYGTASIYYTEEMGGWCCGDAVC